MVKASILITTFQRAHLLQWNLVSLSQQNIPFPFETIVLNDGLPDDTESLCQKYEKSLNLRYVFTGQRNLAGTIHYRVPAFAQNIGARLSKGEYLVFCCAEMFHLNHTIAQLIDPLRLNPNYLTTSIGMDDDGSFLEHLEQRQGAFDLSAYYRDYPRLNTALPFLMGMARESFFSIGGCDEDFTGLAYDDNDLMGRLILSGKHLVLTQAQVIHLYHPRHDDGREKSPPYLYNQRLFQERQGIIIRNQGREWGKMVLLPDRR